MFGSKKKIRGSAVEHRRRALLTGPASEVAADGLDTSQVWLAAFEVVKPEAIITYVSISDGGTSMYYSTGKGREKLEESGLAAEASREFVSVASHYVSEMEQTDSDEAPEPKNIKFWVREGDKTFASSILEDVVAVGGHPMTKLYQASQDVVKQVHAAKSRR